MCQRLHNNWRCSSWLDRNAKSGWCPRIAMKPFILHIATHLHVSALELRTVKDAVVINGVNFCPGNYGTRRLLLARTVRLVGRVKCRWWTQTAIVWIISVCWPSLYVILNWKFVSFTYEPTASLHLELGETRLHTPCLISTLILSSYQCLRFPNYYPVRHIPPPAPHLINLVW